MSVPSTLIVRYEDGSTTEIGFEKVSLEMQTGLATLGLCPPPPAISPARHFLLLQWKDGWQEVIGTDRDTADLLRCFVIRRIEDRGRLSFETGGEYPELYILKRRPMDLNALLIVGQDNVKSYDLGTEVERWEGTFDAGGKLEYIKWDKTAPKNFPSGVKESPEALHRIADLLKDELNKIGIGARDLLGMEESRRIETYSDICKALGLRGYRKQADVYGFVELLVRRAAQA